MYHQKLSNNLLFNNKKWRFLREITTNGGKEYLYVVAFPTDWFAIKNVTVDDFLYNHDRLKLLQSSRIDFLRTAVPCPVCLGWGKLNWIEIARGGLPRQRPTVYDEKLFNISSFIDCYRDCKKPYKFIISKPELNPAEKLCISCLGSGIALYHIDGPGRS
jgi:hypothetical protein